jgi:hypothetical protein
VIILPDLLKLFLNDFSDIIENSNDSVYLQDKNISCLLYADDLILISDSEKALWKSTKHTNNFFVSVFRYFSKIHFNTKMWSEVLDFFENPIWFS